MRRQVCWVEKLDNAVRREVRVSFQGGKIKWQFRRSDTGAWDYDSPPTDQDWENLRIRSEARYCRRRIPMRDLELVRKRAAFNNKRNRSL